MTKLRAKLAAAAAVLAVGVGAATPALADLAIVYYGTPYGGGPLTTYNWITSGGRVWATYDALGGIAFCDGWTYDGYVFDEVTCSGEDPASAQPVYGSGLTWWMPNW